MIIRPYGSEKLHKLGFETFYEAIKFKIILKSDPEDGGYNVSCPALPGCHSQGDTIEQATTNIQEAIEGCLEALADRFY